MKVCILQKLYFFCIEPYSKTKTFVKIYDTTFAKMIAICNVIILHSSNTGVVLYGGPRASELLSISDVHSFHHEYSTRACAIEIVNDVDAAIKHIHKHGRYINLIYLCRCL